MLSEIEIAIIRYLQSDIPLKSRPFAELSQQLGISEEETVNHIEDLKNRGLLRRLAAILRHQEAGFKINALVAWQVDVSKMDEVGQRLAENKNVSHCYHRQVPKDFGYNLFTMVHARSDEELQDQLSVMSDQVSISQYTVIQSLEEYKKVSMTYF